MAFLGDLWLHVTVEHSPWLTSREHLIAGGVLGAAGLFQFTSVKSRCLTQCRLPSAFLAANYRPGIAGGFHLGRKHGVFCAGCCAALMLLMFAAGVANLLWMASLTAVMVHEKTGPASARTVHLTGLALLTWAIVVVAQPAWLPGFLAGAL